MQQGKYRIELSVESNNSLDVIRLSQALAQAAAQFISVTLPHLRLGEVKVLLPHAVKQSAKKASDG